MTHHVDLSRVHLIGIGGAGMSGVARILLSRGAVVTGSDMKDSRPVRALRTMGARIAIGHTADNLHLGDAAPTVVVTSFKAIPEDNPELVAAHAANIPVIKRSDLLAELMNGSFQVLIGGTHGKTSTTSMTVVAMQAAGLDPSFAIGGQLNRAGTNAHAGTGTAFVAEADESDASLLTYVPDVAVITNAEPDHLDFFGTPENYFRVFDDFADRVGDNDGTLVVCLDDEHARATGQRAAARGVTVVGYGTRPAAEATPDLPAAAVLEEIRHDASGVLARVRVGEDTVDLHLQIPGEHMVLNAMAALVSGLLAGGDRDRLVAGLNGFTGVRRRFEFHGEITAPAYAGVRVYDDYAHHPTEVAAVLTAAREKLQAAGRGKLIALFQPHLYSRTMDFAAEFAAALSLADNVILLEIYAAREEPVDGVDARIISDRVDAQRVAYEPDFSQVPDLVAQWTEPGDMVMTIGAGSVTMLAPQIVARLSN